MGREEKHNLGLVKETAFKSETLQANALNHLQHPVRCSCPLGCRPALQSGTLRRLLGCGSSWHAKLLHLVTVTCWHPSGSREWKGGSSASDFSQVESH